MTLHQAVHQMEKCHFHTCLGKTIGRLDAEQAAADYDGAGVLAHQGAHGADISEIAKGEDVLKFHAWFRQPYWSRAGREHELGK